MFTAAVLIVVISGISALAAQFTSKPAEEIVEYLVDVPKAMIETHEGTALIVAILAPITTLLAIILVFLSYLGKVKSMCSRSQSCLSRPW
jgi:hypothetical protein